MADAFVSTAELLQLGDGNISDIDVSELLEEAPVLAAMAAQQASYETQHDWLKKTAAPGVAYRAINDGVENTKAVYSKVTIDLALLDAGFAMDWGLMQTRSGEALKRREAVDHLKAAFADLEKQIFYGTDNQATGFEGFAQETTVDDLADLMVVNAGGTTVDTASSVWAVRNSMEAVSVVYGLNGTIQIGQEYMTKLAGSVTGRYDAVVTPMLFYGGVQVATSWDLARVVNITEDADAGLTDDLLSQAIGKFPAGMGPSFFAMTRRSLQQLQASRTATNPTGAPAPFPESAFNVPIIATDQLNDVEALIAAPGP